MLKLNIRTQRPENADFPLKSQEEELGVVRALIFSYFASRRQIAKARKTVAFCNVTARYS